MSSAADESMENIGILSHDPGLVPFKDHFKYRVERYENLLNLLEKHEGGLEEFAQGAFLNHIEDCLLLSQIIDYHGNYFICISVM